MDDNIIYDVYPIYPNRQEMKDAHQAADELHIDYDSHTLKPGIVEFLKDKQPVARYDIVTGEIRVLSGQSILMVDEADTIDKKVWDTLDEYVKEMDNDNHIPDRCSICDSDKDRQGPIRESY